MMHLFDKQPYDWPEIDDSKMVTMTILDNLHDSCGECFHSIYDGIELATDILMASDDSSEFGLGEKTVPSFEAPVKVIAPILPPAPVPVRKPSRTSSTQTDAPAVIIEEIVHGAKKGSFQSGKDKFLQDVSY